MKKNRVWILIILAYSLVRAALFASFWQASKSLGGWQNFYQQAYAFGQQGTGPMNLFHEYCDWHPPLYYFLNSAVLLAFQAKWPIYFFQFALGLIALFICYKIARLFLSEKPAYLAAFIMAVEPLWAWQFLLYTSENLSIPLFVGSVYFFFKYYRTAKLRELALSSVLLGLATLTRPNYLMLAPILPIFFLITFYFKKLLKLSELSGLNWKKALVSAAVYLAVFCVIIAPWMARNYFVYGRFALANIISTNVYFYNVPALIAWQKKIPYTEASEQMRAQAKNDLGENVGDQGDCFKFSLADFNRDLEYYSSRSKKYILDNLPDYMRIHLVRSIPYFFQPGYFEIWSAYTGVYNKPDFSTMMQNGDLRSFINVLKTMKGQMQAHMAGIIFWGICSVSLFLSLIASFFYDRRKFIFFLTSVMIIAYNALLISPFVTARYRLPVYILFVVSLIYAVQMTARFIALPLKKKSELVKKFPPVAIPAKFLQERLREIKLQKTISQIAANDKLPYESELPPRMSLGHEPTIRCNLQCKMCYQRENRGIRKEEVPADKVLEFYEKFGGVNQVKLVGGEPLVYPGIFRLLDYWDNRQVPIVLQTNCTLFNSENIAQLANVKNLKSVLTSLDGPEEIHDSIRGVKGSFKKMQAAVSMIREKMPEVEISAFATLLLNDNIDSLFDLIKTAKSVGLTGINVLFEQVYSPAEVANAKKILANKFGWHDGADYRLNTQVREVVFSKLINPAKLKRKLLLVRLYGAFWGVPVNLTPLNYYDNLAAYLGQAPARPFCHKLLNEELRVNQEGDVIWCDIIEKSFGNLNDKTPEEIWLSADFQDFRRFLHKQSLPICYRCCKASYLKK